MKITKILLVLALTSTTESANILCYFFVPSPSHHMVFQTIPKGLVERGHNVTVLTTNPLNDPSIENLTEIDLSISYEYTNRIPLSSVTDPTKYWLPAVYKNLNEWQNNILEIQFQQEEVKRFFNHRNQRFDVILAEIHSPIVHVFGHIFKAPVIGMSSLGVFLYVHDAVGNPSHPLLTTDLFTSVPKIQTFVNKVNRFLFFIWQRLYHHYYLLPRSTDIVRKHFGQSIPYLGDLEKNVSLIMMNVNPFLQPARPRVPMIIELDQMHIKPEKPLPVDLQAFLDASKEGVVYFSLGTNIKFSTLDTKFRDTINAALPELPYNVLFKLDAGFIDEAPQNVFVKNWLPQQDVLRHPNIKAFVTQGGLQSIEEGILNRVPLVGIPFFGDQHSNVRGIVKLGIGRYIDRSTMTKQDLIDAIMEVSSNDKYRRNAEHIGNLMKDQPITGLEKVVYWTEYVIRHQGAPHLRNNEAIAMSWPEYLMLDVILFLSTILTLFLYLSYVLTRFLINLIQKKIKYKTL